MVSDRSVLITGSSTGIGKATALHLDRLGFRVFAGVRKANDGDALCAQASERLTPVLVDVTDPKAVARAREVVSKAAGEGGLSGLVNNAGVGFSLPVEFVPLDKLRELFEVNVFGLVAVTQAFLPLVRQAHGRIINVSSLASIMVAPFHGPYSASKLAVNGFSRSLRMEMKPFGVQVSVVLPGTIDTPIWQKGAAWSERAKSDQAAQVDQLYGNPYGKFRQYMAGMGRRGISPEEVARAIAHALTAKRARHYYLIGRDTQLLSLLVSIVPERFHDQIILRRIGIEG